MVTLEKEGTVRLQGMKQALTCLRTFRGMRMRSNGRTASKRCSGGCPQVCMKYTSQSNSFAGHSSTHPTSQIRTEAHKLGRHP